MLNFTGFLIGAICKDFIFATYLGTGSNIMMSFTCGKVLTIIFDLIHKCLNFYNGKMQNSIKILWKFGLAYLIIIVMYWNILIKNINLFAFLENRIDMAFGRCTLPAEINWSSFSNDCTGQGFASSNC